MMLFERNLGSNEGWQFVAYLCNVPRELKDCTKEYRYAWISSEC